MKAGEGGRYWCCLWTSGIPLLDELLSLGALPVWCRCENSTLQPSAHAGLRDVLYICVGVTQSIAKGTDFAERCRLCFSSSSEHRCRTKTTLVHLTLAFETLAFGPSSIDSSLGTCGLLYLMANSFSFHVACWISSERDRTLQVELEGAQALRSRLEEVLGRSLERLNRLESLAAIGGGELESVQVHHKHAFWALAGSHCSPGWNPVHTNQRKSCLTGQNAWWLTNGRIVVTRGSCKGKVTVVSPSFTTLLSPLHMEVMKETCTP